MKRKITGDEYLFEILIFLATSARGCVDEPPLCGPFRLIDALSKLIDLPDYAPCLKKDNFTMKVKRDIDEKSFQ